MSNSEPNSNTAFCIEGSTYSDNVALITGSTLWNDPAPNFPADRCGQEENGILCFDSAIAAHVSEFGSVYVNSVSGDYHSCNVENYGILNCR